MVTFLKRGDILAVKYNDLILVNTPPHEIVFKENAEEFRLPSSGAVINATAEEAVLYKGDQYTLVTPTFVKN